MIGAKELCKNPRVEYKRGEDIKQLIKVIELDIIKANMYGRDYVIIDYIPLKFWRQVACFLKNRDYTITQDSGLGMGGTSNDMVIRWR